MPNFRWTLNNTVSGILVIGDPMGWEELNLTLVRDELWHSVTSEFITNLGFYCTLPSGIEGGKEYIDNIYETQGIDALVTILVEYRCADESFDTLFDGKLNMPTYKTGIDDDVGEMTFVDIVRNDFWQTVRDGRDIPINLNSLIALDGSALTAYTFAPASINLSSQIIDLQSEIDGTAFLDQNIFDGIIRPQFATGVAEQIYFQSLLPVTTDDLTTIGDNPDFHNKSNIPITVIEPNLVTFYNSEENSPIRFPETYTVSWNITGTFTDTIGVVQNRSLVTNLTLFIVYGQDYTTAQVDLQLINLGVIAGYVTGFVNPFGPIPFAFAGNQNIIMNRGDKIWLVWQSTGGGYLVTTGVGPHTLVFDFNYTTSQLTLDVASVITPGTDPGFALYETGARLSESITGQTPFAFKSDLLGRTDSQPNVGGAPVYGVDGCGSLNFDFSGLAMRGYGKHKIESPLPDFATLTDFFDCVDAVYNAGMGMEQHSGQDVLRLEELDFFYSNSSIIQLTNVNNIQFVNDESFSYNELEIGFAQFEPENFNGLDEINTKQSYNLPIRTIKNKLTKLSPWLASGYAIEDVKRTIFTQGRDHKYDNNRFIIAVKRVLMTFAADDDTDFSATVGIDNPTTRRNIKITPKRNLLRHLNVLGGGIEKTAGATIDFREGADNFYFTTTQIANGCNGDYTGNLLNEDGNIAWDDPNARLNVPLWIPEVYEFDHPLTEVQYTTIRNNPHGFIEFSSTTTGFIQGFILQIDYPLSGGLTHFKLLRRNS